MENTKNEGPSSDVPPRSSDDGASPVSAREPKITVATVTFNAAPLIEHTIRSVEKQKWQHVEHLIVDGNSRDETLEHIHHYQERNSVAAIPHEIQCLSEPDDGLYDAMNKAIDMATGDFIVFLNAGDCFHDDMVLTRVAEAAAKAEKMPAVVYGDTHIVDGEGNFMHHRHLSPPEHLTWRSFRNGMLVCHQAFFARTDLARRFHYNLRYRYSADFDWCVRIMKQAARDHAPLVNAHTVVADYLEEGMTTKHHKASLRERFHIMTVHFGWPTTLARHAWFCVRSVTKK